MGVDIAFKNMAKASPAFCVVLLFVLIRTNEAFPNNFGLAKNLEGKTDERDIVKDIVDQVNPNAESVRALFRRSKDAIYRNPEHPHKGKDI